jgi:hypothetical protein
LDFLLPLRFSFGHKKLYRRNSGHAL